MREAPTARVLPNGRLLLQHGPIDLVIAAEGPPEAVRTAREAAMRRFDGLLAELCEELTSLRMRARPGLPAPSAIGSIARRMQGAVGPFAARTFITPMASVAGAVAEEILGVMCAAAPLRRAFVNNGGDIAFHLARGESTRIGLVDRPDRPSLFGAATVAAQDPVRGVATSGYPGRSFSRGIAEAVTVLARTAAGADAAATVIANAVDLPRHPAVERARANDVQADSDLGDILVTRAVGTLTQCEIAEAIDPGLREAACLRTLGLVEAVAIHVQGTTRVVGLPASDPDLMRIRAHA